MEKMMLNILLIPTIGGVVTTLCSIVLNDFNLAISSMAITIFSSSIYLTGLLMKKI